MEILGWVVIGGVAGWLASIVMKTGAQMGLLANIVVGVLGAFLGGWLLGLLNVANDPSLSFNWMSLLTAFVGAVVLLFVLKIVRGGK